MTQLRKPTSFASVLAVAAGLAPAEAQVEVLATVGMVADVAAEIGGDCAQVTSLIGPGIDPHDYQPTASDVRRLRQAELILHVGFDLEGRMGTILARMGQTRPVVAVAEAAAAPEALLFEAPEVVDPHLWMDVSLWARTIPVISEALTEQAPDCAPAMAQRAAEYGVKLEALDAWVAETLATVPSEARVLVTAHDAFSYFARAYDFGLSEAIEGISTESEASIADIRAVARIVRDLEVPAVFTETTINPRTIEALVAEVRAMGHEVTIGGALFSDAPGAADTPEGSYIGMIRANTITIASALGGAAVPLPTELTDWAARWGIED